MDSMQAFLLGQLSKARELMVFDWDKAARLIKSSGAQEAYAGLRDDWEWTSAIIFAEGEALGYTGGFFSLSHKSFPLDKRPASI